MPFWTSEQDHRYPPNVRLESISPKDFRLLTPFVYVPRDGSPHVTVIAFDPEKDDPESNVGKTDLASVPPLLWGLLASYGRQLRAALLHDQLCEAAKSIKSTDRSRSYADRRRADLLFRMSMRDPGDGTPADIKKRVGWARSWIFFAAVSWQRYLIYRKFRVLLMTAQVVAGVIATYLLIPGVPRGPLNHWLPFHLGMHWYGYLVTLAFLFLLCLAWGRDWRVPLVGLLVAPIVLPALVVTFVATRLVGLPDLVASWLPNEPDPNWGPTRFASSEKTSPFDTSAAAHLDR
jgi:hypothetical protein